MRQPRYTVEDSEDSYEEGQFDHVLLALGALSVLPRRFRGKNSPPADAKTTVTYEIDNSRHANLHAVAAPSVEPLDPPGVDRRAAEHAAAALLEALGADLRDESLRETPRRMAALYGELLSPAPFDATTFPNDGDYDELVVAREIPFHSLCEHHLLPFVGVAHVGYLPGARIIGLSKLARVVDYFARSLQVQERLTTQIAGWLRHELKPKGVGVVLEAEHMCMSLRGVQKHGVTTVTSALHGLVRDDPRTRQEFLALTGGSRS